MSRLLQLFSRLPLIQLIQQARQQREADRQRDRRQPQGHTTPAEKTRSRQAKPVKSQRKQARRNKSHQEQFAPWRFRLAVMVLLLLLGGLIGRIAWIQLVDPDRLIREGDMRSLRTLATTVERGIITDRHGQELAISVPAQAVWLDPKKLLEADGLSQRYYRRWQALAELLKLDLPALFDRVRNNPSLRFIYVQRQISPAEANFVTRLELPYVFLKKESRRFYPTGEVSAHVVGFTDIDDKGLEGLERSYDHWLTGKPGRSQVRKDQRGRVIEQVAVLEHERPPQDLQLSIDQRIQALAYRVLKRGTTQHQARAGSVVVLDVHSGEVLAMVNTPSFNPNRREQRVSHRTRNRAITDTFEPGSPVKPLVVAGALQSGAFTADSVIDTSPGWMSVGGSMVRDTRDQGQLDLRGVLQKSSNVGVSKIALDMELEPYLDLFYKFGFGIETGIGLVGEQGGVMRPRRRWSDFELATLSFGYGLTVTPLQLAQAFAILGSGGVRYQTTLLKQDKQPEGERVFSREVTQQVVEMLVSVTEEGGTAPKARVPGYRIAGKTGTARKAVAGGYGDDYIAVFAGIAPATNPRLAVVVLVDEPAGDLYYGGEVAAPVFAEIMQGTLQLLNIAPDGLPAAR